MMRTIWILAVISLVFISACGEAPKVIQGTITDYDTVNQIVTVKDENPPNIELQLFIKNADYSEVPHVGALVRIAYRQKHRGMVARRIMDVNAMLEMKKRDR